MKSNQGISERKVLLGNPATYQMKHPIRLLTVYDSQENPVVIVTNEMDLSAEEISEVYRRRWQIELFFKWIKQHLTVKHFFGTSANTVYGQIWMALIGYCLLQNLHQTLPQRNTLLDLLRAVQTKLYDAFAELLAVLSRIPARTSRRRRPNSFSADYAQLLKEIKEYGTDFLDAAGEDMYL